jgi:hypothetical protein
MKMFFVFFVLVPFLFCNCASISEQMNYEKEARQHEFEYYFPSISGERVFADLDLAYAYMNEAIAKFDQISGKTKAKGGGAILNGPPQSDQSVRIVYFMNAFGQSGQSTLTATTTNVQQELRASIGTVLVFLIFVGDKSGCQSCYYLKDGYVFSNNSYATAFNAYGNKYTADYRVGWTLKNVYEYLKAQ